MDKKEIIAKVNPALADEFEVEESKMVPEASIKETLALDSLSLVDLVVLIEKNFGVKVKGNEIAEVKTFDDLYNFILGKLN